MEQLEKCFGPSYFVTALGLFSKRIEIDNHFSDCKMNLVILKQSSFLELVEVEKLMPP